jgi:hypothetical protein
MRTPGWNDDDARIVCSGRGEGRAYRSAGPLPSSEGRGVRGEGRVHREAVPKTSSEEGAHFVGIEPESESSGTPLGCESSSMSLGHYQAGDIFRVDLTPATALANHAVDLRVEVEDAAGNRLSWTQEPAFIVGTVADEPGRGRAVGR